MEAVDVEGEGDSDSRRDALRSLATLNERMFEIRHVSHYVFAMERGDGALMSSCFHVAILPSWKRDYSARSTE